MENKIINIFSSIHAENALVENTAEFLHDEIQRRSNAQYKVKRSRFLLPCVSLAMILIISGFSYNLLFTAMAYIDMDVNPSIELVVNRFNRVIKATPYNDDGAVILNELNVKNLTYEKAVQTLLSEMNQQEYLKSDGLVSVTVQAKNSGTEQQLLDDITKAVDVFLTSHHSAASSDIFTVSDKIRSCAHDYNLSPAKYLAIINLLEVDSTATFEGCSQHSISELRQLTKEHQCEHHEKHEKHGNH